MKSDQVAHSLIQSGLADHQGWRLYNLPGHPASLLDCPQRVQYPLPNIQSKSLLFPFMSVISCPPTTFLCEEPSCIFSLTFSQVLGSCLWSHLFPGLTSPGPRASPHRASAPATISWVALHWTCFCSTSFLYWLGVGQNPELDAVPRCGLASLKYR